VQKLLLFLLILVVSVESKQIEVFASQVSASGNTLYAEGDVVVLYDDIYLSAQRAVLDKNSSDIELFGHIFAMQGSDLNFLGDYAHLNLNASTREFSPFYLYEKSFDVWLSTANANANPNKIDLKSGILSGCDPKKPLWKILFSSADYNLQSKWVNAYNARLLINDIPVFYTPYLGYSLDTTRRTGILAPGFGVSNDEGLFFQQPFYIVGAHWWDIELRPQIRTLRGQGLYGDFRFVDTAYSKGEISFGRFNEYSSYLQERNLTIDHHEGFGVNYSNTNLLKSWFKQSFDVQSALYIDALHMSDVEYLNLQQQDSTKFSTATQTYSRINLFLNEEKNYVGIYGKYFQDLTLQDNDYTIQNLPIIQYHHYLQSFFDNYLLANFDVTSINFYRKKGVNAQELQLDVPVTLQTALLDDFLNLSYGVNVISTGVTFENSENTDIAHRDTTRYENGSYARLDSKLSASTSLLKRFKTISHQMNIDIDYQFSSNELREGCYNSEKNCSSAIQEISAVTQPSETVSLEFSQFIFGDKAEKKVYHRVSQQLALVDTTLNALSEIENELEWYITPQIILYNNTFFNHARGRLSKLLDSFSFHNNHWNVTLSHLYEERFNADTTIDYTNAITSSIQYVYNKHYSYLGKYDYDIENFIKKRSEVGFLYSKRCWDFGLRYVENNRPVLLNNNISSSIFDKYIYITVRFKPLNQDVSEFGQKSSEFLQGP